MRNLIAIGLSIFLFAACQETSDKNQLEAQLANVEDGTKITVSEMVNGNQTVPIDSAEVKDGKFTINLPEVEYQTLNTLSIEGVNGGMLFINENKSIKAEIFKDSLGTSNIKGGEANEMFTDYLKRLNESNRVVMNEVERFSPEELQDPEVQNEIRDIQVEREKENTKFRKEIIKDNPDLLPSIFVFVDLINSGQADDAEMRELFDGLSDDLKQTYFGKAIGEELSKTESVAIGTEAPDFAAKTPEGEEFSLKDALDKDGEYVLIEFWASWCPYCQEELPNVVEVYNDYHDKGLNVLGVSIDEEKGEWEEAIKGFGMEWDNISNLSKWEDPIVGLYNVRSVPYNFLVDKEGNIVAKDLQGEDLRKKMEELLGS